MMSPFNQASNAISRRTLSLLNNARNDRDKERIRRASMKMQAGLQEKGLANSGG